ncbi:hypothetical protein HYU13_03555 [Candidatus Woesearchaeota archaeon]|nr:hypothetical protein [Candidatus Woesearchaeota archaeon]
MGLQALLAGGIGKEFLERAIVEVDFSRPWGGFITFHRDREYTSKLLFLNNELSVQSHKDKDERFMVLSGAVEFYSGNMQFFPDNDFDKPAPDVDLIKTIANLQGRVYDPGEAFAAPRNCVHVTINANPESFSVIAEYARGRAREEDITRHYDRNERYSQPLKEEFQKLRGFEDGMSAKELIQLCRNPKRGGWLSWLGL